MLMFAALYMKDMDSFAAHQSIFVNSLGLASEFAKGRATKQSFEKASSAIESGERR